jgi:predicted nucleic acid-binding protein
MTQVLLFDTNVWSHLVMANKENSLRVKEQLEQLRSKYPYAIIATSGMCVAECLVGARSLLEAQKRDQAEEQYQSLFTELSLNLVAVNADVLDKAAYLRAESVQRAKTKPVEKGGKLKLPDAIVAASCLTFDPPAILVTENDKDFRYLNDQGVSCTVADLVVEKIG